MTPHRLSSHALCLLVAALLSSVAPSTGAAPKDIRIYDARPAPPPLHAMANLGDLLSDATLDGKVVVVNFWATWCTPCKAEMPSMDRMYRKFRDQGLTMLAIAMGDTDEGIRDYQARARKPVSFRLIAGDARQVAENWAVSIVPTTYVLDRRGQIAIRVSGDMDWQSPAIVDPVRRLLAEDAGTVK